MDFSEARVLFEKLAGLRGLRVIFSDDSAALEQGHLEQAHVRLRKSSTGFILEITHGPPDGVPQGWLVLYSDAASIKDPDLAECIDYALELAIKK